MQEDVPAFDQTLLSEIIAEDKKKRYSYGADKRTIRANQGDVYKRQEYDSSNKLESMVVDTDGMMISARDKDKIGTNVDFIPKMKEKSGTFSMGGRLYIYQKVSDWRFYVVSSVPMMELYKSSIRTIFLMAFILLFLLTISLLVVKRIISKVYRPLDKVVRKMDDVASGSLKTRINVEHMGEDFTKLAVGFNSMMEMCIRDRSCRQEGWGLETASCTNCLILNSFIWEDNPFEMCIRDRLWSIPMTRLRSP